MKNILIFATIASIAIVVAYYLIIENDGDWNDVSIYNED